MTNFQKNTGLKWVLNDNILGVLFIIFSLIVLSLAFSKLHVTEIFVMLKIILY